MGKGDFYTLMHQNGQKTVWVCSDEIEDDPETFDLDIYRAEAGDVRPHRSNDHAASILYVHGDVWFVLGDERFTRDASADPSEAAAMRKLAELATEAAEELERRAGAPS